METDDRPASAAGVDRTVRLETVLRAHRDMCRLVARERDRERVLAGTCEAFVRAGAYRGAWIALVGGERYGAPTAPAAGPALPPCCDAALTHDRPRLIREPQGCPALARAPEDGAAVAVSARLEHDGKLYGVLCGVLAGAPADEQQEQRLFEELAADLAFALHAIELELRRVSAEQRIKEYTGELGTIVEERDREVAGLQERLLQAERLATLGQLAGGLGHELRNPLGAIKNIGFLLRMTIEEPSPDIAEALDLLDDQIAATVRIIDSLLDYARPKEPQIQIVPVEGVLRRALKLTHVPPGVDVQLDLDPQLPAALVDPDQILHVVANIVRNAGQAMADGGTLRISGRLDAGATIALRFADTGPGIPPETLPRVFEALFTTKARGIGLGLALCKLLVERNGGSVTAHSEPGAGATFTVRLPQAEG